MTDEEYEKEWRYRYHERMSLILEDSRYETGQRPMTRRDKQQARREADEAIRALKQSEQQ